MEWGWSDWMGHHSQDLNPDIHSRSISNALSLGLVLKHPTEKGSGQIAPG